MLSGNNLPCPTNSTRVRAKQPAESLLAESLLAEPRASACTVPALSARRSVALALTRAVLFPPAFLRFAALPARLSAGSPALQRYQSAEPHMGTLVGITLFAPSEELAAQAFAAAYAKIAEVNRSLSNYLPDSEVNQLSADWQPMSPHLTAVARHALDLERRTAQAFRASLGAVTALWKNVARQQRPWPEPSEIAPLLAECGFSLSPDHKIRLKSAQTRLDFGALGKGYAADVALAELQRLGIRHALVACSGDIAVSLPPPGQTGWKVQAGQQAQQLRQQAVSTSGDSNQFLLWQGQRFSHILDGRTGFPLPARSSVSAVASSGLQADGASTCGYLLGIPRARALFPRIRLLAHPLR